MSCPININPELEKALNTPEVLALKEKLRNEMNEIPCEQSHGKSMSGGMPNKNTIVKITKITATVGSILSLVGSYIDVGSAYQSQCSTYYLITNFMGGSSYCANQTAILSTAVAWAVTKTAAVGSAAVAAYLMEDTNDTTKYIEDTKKGGKKQRKSKKSKKSKKSRKSRKSKNSRKKR